MCVFVDGASGGRGKRVVYVCGVWMVPQEGGERE